MWNTWYTLRVTHQGCRLHVFYDGKQVFNLWDKTFHAGTIGLWTKSDAVTYFDDPLLKTVSDSTELAPT